MDVLNEGECPSTSLDRLCVFYDSLRPQTVEWWQNPAVPLRPIHAGHATPTAHSSFVLSVLHDQPKPYCSKPRCYRPARYYGPIGGYGKLCDICADEKCVKQRAARRRRLSSSEHGHEHQQQSDANGRRDGSAVTGLGQETSVHGVVVQSSS